jgi:hypothetical protein
MSGRAGAEKSSLVVELGWVQAEEKISGFSLI